MKTEDEQLWGVIRPQMLIIALMAYVIGFVCGWLSRGFFG